MTEQQDNIIRLDLTVPVESVDSCTAFLFDRIQYGWEEKELEDGRMLFRLHIEDPAFAVSLSQELGAAFPGVTVEQAETPNRNWMLAWRDFFTAVPCGEDFIVLAPWMVDEQPYPERIPIQIEPKMAFGTGHHPTTALCLTVLSQLHRQGAVKKGMRFLDLGTGSGILGLGCAKLGMSGMGLDTDPLAIENCHENKEVNEVGDEFQVSVGSIEAVQGEKFDLVLANILAEPLIDLAPQIKDALAPGGRLVLSGLLTIQVDKVQSAYTELGMPEAERLISDEWAALVF